MKITLTEWLAPSQAITISSSNIDLKSHDRPLQAPELAARQCIRVPGDDSDMVWRLLYGEEGVNTANNVTVNVRGRFSTNNVDIMKMLAARAAGIAALNPALLVDAQDRGALVFPSMRSASDSKLGACSAVPTYAGA